MDGGIEAANAGHGVVMSPTTYAYFRLLPVRMIRRMNRWLSEEICHWRRYMSSSRYQIKLIEIKDI